MADTEQPKKMSIKEFRKAGYLQELNRQFLHPLGLALEVQQNEDGSESLGGIWDCREDKEGIHYDLHNPDNISNSRLQEFNQKANFIAHQFAEKGFYRDQALGFFIEPIPRYQPLTDNPGTDFDQSEEQSPA